ncbi:oxygen-independent coproporphyrinogen III oxidase [Candidatus Sulfidibacterium hydrothermale]|uniref:oxygen-independent coproporphyrinogen III oxidase n=1 Tax=Candidatus Sulfidibacterium hydrothermale TaxID=2875962 RepID=UPI001F0A848D|nr:oxygen-independent coproporphyrinogen III oxidase [Candidatus Sulfidibacterium hydrothermale]UBM63521.1 oxygen-independent coproporphyrinogen III oxidase [Candidatus Sulfidibacterium hydrothermale]
MNLEIFKKYNKPGPRYTSYPPATFFKSGFTPRQYIEQIVQSNNDKPQNLSFYVHIPFCPRLCHFCGCNTGISQKEEVIRRYVDAVITEIENVAKHLDKSRKVSQIHWGGGTPNSINLNYVEEIMAVFQKHFQFIENPEIAMECHPAYLEYKDIDRLQATGFNRLSLGVQDFDEEVLRLVNRAPSKHPVKELVQYLKQKGFRGVNLDLIYGLPGQTKESFARNIEKTIEVSPDRLATFSYAHVPWVKAAQKILEKRGLPTPDQKLEMFETGHRLLTDAGYVAIGMDHYAKADDDLTKALHNKTLHRNFQGYATRETTGQVYGFGSSSITQLYGGYIQNVKTSAQYVKEIEKHGLAPDKAYLMKENDLVVRQVIAEVMCNGLVDFDEIGQQFGKTAEEVKKITEFSPEKLNEFLQDQLISIDGNRIQVHREGFFIVRNIAMAFDPLLKTTEAMYSKTI